MPDLHQTDQLTFKVYPPGGGSEVPVALLTNSLLALEELVHVFAMQEEGRTVRQRLKVPAEIANKYALYFSPPEVGSFAVTARVTSLTTDDLLARERIGNVVHNFIRFSAATATSDAAGLMKIVPDSRLRMRALSCLSKLGPSPGSGFRFELSNGTGEPVQLEETLSAQIEALRFPTAERSEIQTVTGSVDTISFSERRLTILYRPKRRWLECTYDESFQPMLVENRRDLVQVTGRVIMDDENHPKKIVEVEEVRELDLSPFVISEIAMAEGKLKPRQAVSLKPFLSDSEQLICLEHPLWGLDVFASTRVELFDELKEQIGALWAEYARESDGLLSAPSLALKQQLLGDWLEVPNAKG